MRNFVVSMAVDSLLFVPPTIAPRQHASRCGSCLLCTLSIGLILLLMKAVIAVIHPSEPQGWYQHNEQESADPDHALTARRVARAQRLAQRLNRQDDLPGHVFRACAKGDAETVREWLRAGGHVNARLRSERDGFTLLFAAVTTSHAALVDELLTRGADVNVQAAVGFTPLMYATERGLKEMVQRLLRAGARTDIKCHGGDTVHSLAYKQQQDEIAELISDYDKSKKEKAKQEGAG